MASTIAFAEGMIELKFSLWINEPGFSALDHIIISLILTIAGYYLRACKSYLKDQDYVKAFEKWKTMYSSCGCSEHYPQCRYLYVTERPKPISWMWRFTCKETATAACKISVKDVPKIWIKVPTEDDKMCFDFYKETQFWASSCN